jgi:hypothetical protein
MIAPYKYRSLLWQFIAAMDSGKYNSLDIADVKLHANAGTMSAFLVDRFGDDLDLSLFEAADLASLNETWASIANAVDARRKFGVENKGICLLMAYALESMQMLQREAEGR